MQALKSIVVGLDFSDCSRVALMQALRIASWSNAALHPVHVVETRIDSSVDEAGPASMHPESRAGLLEDARSRWEAISDTTPGAHELTFEVCVGSRLACIREQLALHQADLLVLGAFGAIRPHVGMGTFTSGCIRGVATDVLVVRDNCRDAFRNVAVGIDFSAQCLPALESAALVARHEGARLHAVHVAPDHLETYARLRGDLLPRLRDFVAAATGPHPGLEVRCHVYPHSGHRSGILEFATLVNADLIAVGTRGRTNLRDVVLGSTAEKVLRDSVVAIWASKAAQEHAEIE